MEKLVECLYLKWPIIRVSTFFCVCLKYPNCFPGVHALPILWLPPEALQPEALAYLKLTKLDFLTINESWCIALLLPSNVYCYRSLSHAYTHILKYTRQVLQSVCTSIAVHVFEVRFYFHLDILILK